MITEEFVQLSPAAVTLLLERRSAAVAATASPKVRQERRRHDRGGFMSMVELWVPLADGESEYVLATCRDLGAGGVGITCDRELPVNITLPIAIHQPEMTFHGEATIRFCMHGPGGYHVGMEFEESQKLEVRSKKSEGRKWASNSLQNRIMDSRAIS